MLTEVDERDIYAALMVVEDVLLVADRRPAWMADAACRGEPVELFFPGKGPVAAAIAICARCPVRDDCHDYAAEQESTLVSVWAGLGRQARLRERRA